MTKSVVALVRCESYHESGVREAVVKGINLLGGLAHFFKPEESVLLKPNILSADLPERCSTTHPAVFKAVGALVKEHCRELTYGDSPGVHSPSAAAAKAGIAAAAADLGIPLADFTHGQEVFFPEAVQNKKFVIADGVLAADGIISIAKLKTHGLTKMTGAIKNQFGCVPGALKGEFHAKIPDVNNFAKMLVDLNRLLKPRLYVMDGIIAMEGNGPRGGTPRPMHVLLFSADPVALDATVCRIVHLNPQDVPTTRFGQEAGLGTYQAEHIELVGDPIEMFYNPAFKVNREQVKPFRGQRLLGFIRNKFVPRPTILNEKCIQCGVCVQVCPVSPKAVDWLNGKHTVPAYNYNRCIRCFCCQELCPDAAIEIQMPTMRRALTKYRR